jgi:hypothetical protein
MTSAGWQVEIFDQPVFFMVDIRIQVWMRLIFNSVSLPWGLGKGCLACFGKGLRQPSFYF